MKRMKSLTTGLTALIAFAGIMTACGGNSNNEKSSPEASSAAPSASASESPAASLENVKLKFTFWGSPQEKQAVESAVKAFMDKYPHIQVDAQHIPSDFDAKLTTMVSANEAPDVSYLESASLLFPLAEQGKLVNLGDFLANDAEVNQESLVPNLLFNWEPGKVAGIGLAPETFNLFYNEDMFKEVGATPPPAKFDDAWTWDQFVETAKLLTLDENGNNAASLDFNPEKIKQFGVDVTKSWGHWSNFIFSNGADFLSEDGTKIGLSSPESIEVFQKLSDLINVHHVSPSPTQAKSLPGTTASLQTKKVAMVVDGQWMNLDIGNAGFNYNIGILPKLKTPTTTVVTAALGVFSSTKHPQEAWELIKFLINPEYNLDLIKGGLWLPTRKDWYTNEDLLNKWAVDNKNHPSGFKDAVVDMILNHSKPTPTVTVKNFNKIMDIVNPELDKIWFGKDSAENILKAIDAKAQAEVQGRR